MKTVKGRNLNSGQLVEVYYNIRDHIFSVRDKKTGLVVAYSDNVSLKNAVFHVGQKGREKVLEKKQKNVYAWVTGEFLHGDKDISEFNDLKPAYYNPYKTKTFIDLHTGCELNQAVLVHCQNKQVFYR